MKHMKLAFRLVGLVLLVLVLAFTVDLPALGRRLLATDARFLAVALALHLPMIFAKALRWQGLTRVEGPGYGPGRAFVVFLVGLYAGTFTPGRVGELLRATYLSRDGGAPPGAAYATVVGDRLYDLHALLVLGAGGIAWFGLAGRLSIAGVAALAAAAAAPLLLASPRFMERVVRLVLRRHPERAGDHARAFSARLRALFRPRHAARALALTAAGYALFFLQCWWLFAAVGVHLHFADVVFTMALVNLVSLAPVTFAGIGTRDAALVALFALRGLGGDAALAASAVVLLLFHVVTALLGFMAWMAAPLPAQDQMNGLLVVSPTTTTATVKSTQGTSKSHATSASSRVG